MGAVALTALYVTTEQAMHQTILRDLQTALEHFDQHRLLMPAAHLSQTIESLQDHIAQGCDCGSAGVVDLP